MKRHVLVALCLLVFLGTMASVYASTEGKLLIWADDTRSVVMRDLAQQFTTKYKVPVEVQEVNFGEIRDKLAVAGPAGTGPDILIGAHDWLGQLIVNGLLEPIDLGGKKKDFDPVALDAFSWGKELYGVPYSIEAVGLYYNKKLVPKPPATWEELVAIGKKISVKEKKQWGFIVQHPDPYHSFPLMSAGGGYIFGENADGTPNPLDIGLNNKGAVAGLQLHVDLIKEGIMPLGVDGSAMSSLFKDGKVGMVISGPWYIQDFQKGGIDFAVAPIPTINGQKPRPFVGVQAFMVSAFSKNKLMAKAFLNEFVATKETMLALYRKGNRPPVYLPALKEVKDPYIKAFYDSASAGIPMPKIKEMSAVWTAWSNAIELALSGKQTPQQALDEAVAQIKTIIEQSQK